MGALLFCYLTVLYFSATLVETLPPVDVARNRPIVAEITCGAVGVETFVSQRWQWSGGDVRENHTETCYNASTHPPSAMTDGDDSTWWQSTARPNFNQASSGAEIFISIDLQQVFEIQTIKLLMGESLRPRRIVISKSSSDPAFMLEWIYRVQTEQNCTKLYNTPSGTTNVVSLDSKLCQVYLTGPQPLNELITFDLMPITVPNWRFARYLKIEFYDIDLTLGIVGIPFQHYTVRTLTVMAECTCNGQQTDCSPSNITGTFECVCGNNTVGVNCESCLPFFNQYAYQSSTVCQPCNCFNHSEVCFFDQIVANTQGSLNARGERSGGGVCKDCRDNTAGNNCERCLPLYYRPVGVLQTNANPCVPCNCSGPGMQVLGLFGDCVMNIETTVNGMMPGDCRCKSNVVGSQCDRCRDGSYNMSPDNPDGCQSCNCNTNGTVVGSISCDATGQCSCKKFVTNKQCDSCMDGYYGLNGTILDGCILCKCDVGGSLPSGCSKDIGACTCRPGVVGQSCDTPASGYYYPDLHFIFSDFENIRAPWDTAQRGYLGFGYVTAVPQRPVSTTVTPPYLSSFSNQFQMVIRYSATAAGSGTMSVAGLADGITTATVNMTFQACPTPQWCYASLGVLSLPKGFSSTISLDVLGTADPRLLLDRLITIPVEYLNTTNLFGVAEDAVFQARCKVITNGVMADPAYCKPKVFSLATYYLNGALPCECHFLGSSNDTCNPDAGQCTCKTGTAGRKCDTCQIQFYGMTDQGCQPCNCNQTAFKACDNIGQCLCPPGVEGANCDRCMDTYYNYDYSRGCTPCDCNNIGSVTLACNATTGVCTCRPGVIGFRCDQCADGFWQMSYAGCMSCSCDADGSLGTICDKISGQCPCKKNIHDTQCTSCTLNSFAKSVNHTDGCLSCICMGVTDICSSAFTIPLETTQVPLFNASQAPLISVVTASLGPISSPITPQVIDGTEVAEVQIQGSQATYWQAPSLTGDMLKYFEGKISFVAHWVSSDPGAMPSSNVRLLLIGRNNVQFSFAMSVSSVQKNVMTSINVVLSLENVIAAGQTSATRGQLLVALTQVKGVLLPASFTTPSHASRIGNLTYSVTPESVEQCYCPVGYEGFSCENCSSGYMRANVSAQGYLGTCVPCNCNLHSQLCLPDTGQCINCMDNTAGFNCELCAEGYYRDSAFGPMSSCNMCPCFTPRVSNASCAVINGSFSCLQCNPGYTGPLCDSCLPFYYGNPMVLYTGTCSPCNCNGNSAQCDSVTGDCLNCSHFTDGLHCEKCMDGSFGNASSQNCSSCGCNPDWSLSTICNNQTGQCTCVEGVGRRTCDACLDFYYRPNNPPDPSFKGCLPCNCNSFGSATLTCNSEGVCTCKPNTIGTKCDQCQAGNWGLPVQTCNRCDCEPKGINASLSTSCEIHDGQCTCNPGVGQRRCDTCLPMYVNMTVGIGCTACGVCETSLGNSTIALLKKFEDQWNQTLTFQLIQQQDVVLGRLENIIKDAMNQTGLASGYDLVTNLTSLVQELQQTALASQLNATALKSKIDQTAITASQFLNDSSSQYMRVSNIKREADTVRVNTGTQYMNVQSNIQTLRGYNTSAYQLLMTVQGRPSDGTWSWSGLFDTEYRQTQDEVSLALSTLNAVQQFSNAVTDQSNRATGFQKTLQDISSSFTSLSSAISLLNVNIQSFTTKLNQVVFRYNQTLVNKKTADDLWSTAQATITATDAILRQGEASLAAAQQMVTDCQTIINGISFGTLPINTTADLTGITGWTQAYNLVLQQLQALTMTLSNFTQLVEQTERKASSLSQQAQSIVIMFQGVQSRGQPAVDAINGFEKVVELLDRALQMALEANNTMQRTLSQLQSVSINSIEASANQSLAASQAIKQNIDSLMANASTNILNSQLDVANSTLQNAIRLWTDIDQRMASFNAALASLQNVATNVSIMSDLNAGNAACDAALQRLSEVVAQNSQLLLTVSSQASAVAALASDAANMTSMQIQLRTSLDVFRNQENSAIGAISSINASEKEIVSLQPDLAKRFDDLVTKLALIQSKMASLEQPVSFTGTSYETITNPDSGVSRQYNSIGLDFIPSYLKGVLFFAENDQTREKVLIQLVNSSVVFEYSNIDVTNTAVSPATIQVGVWYRVYATRYEFDGQLTVIRMATGGTAVTPMRTVSTLHTQLILNSPLYVGGLMLSNNNLLKVYESGMSFAGCIYNIVFNGAPVPLWQNILRKDSKATCCRKPMPIPSAPTISPCITLYGFGFITYQRRNTYSVAIQAQVALQFRTFGPDAVILMISSPATTDYYSIYLSGGTVVFMISASFNVISVQTANTYNDGQWYQVKATHNPSSIQLVVTRMNQTFSSSPEVRLLSNLNFNLASLANLGFTIGGQNPDVSRGPVATSFSGSVQDFQHSNALSGSLDLQPDSLTTGFNASAAVDLTKCYASVISGLGFLSTSSYAALRSIPSPLRTMYFELVTAVPSGVLFYSPLSAASQASPFLYISLYNGDIFIVFNQGQGVEPSVFRSRGIYLSDSMIHKISLDFSFTNSPRMTIDASETHVGAVTMMPYFNLYDNSIYVGGVPPTVGIDSIFCPVRISLVGGIRNLQINGGMINFFNPNTLSGNNAQGTYLSGLPTPPSVLPPLPYTTLSPPITTAPPSCLPPPPFTYLNNSFVNFAGSTDSYIAYNIADRSATLENAFSIRLSFRALQANGILIYFAGSSATPIYYFSIYLYGGHLRASMMTNTSSIQTKNLQSLYTYDDGNWHEVEVLRVHDFLAVIIATSKDYINNQVSSLIPSQLTFGPTIYLGGVPRSMAGGYPFDASNIAVGMKSFQGCVSNVTLIHYNLLTTMLGSAQEQTRQNVSPCQGNITSGMFINSSVGYVRVSDSINVSPTFDLATGFSFNMTFRTATQAGTLMTAWSSSSRFVALVLSLGQVQVLINSAGQIFSGTSRALPSAMTVCNGQPHSAAFTVGSNSVTLQVDGYDAEPIPFGGGFAYSAPLAVPIYLGGVKDSSWNVPGVFFGTTLQGCIQSVSINGVTYFITESTDVFSATSGCPT